MAALYLALKGREEKKVFACTNEMTFEFLLLHILINNEHQQLQAKNTQRGILRGSVREDPCVRYIRYKARRSIQVQTLTVRWREHNGHLVALDIPVVPGCTVLPERGDAADDKRRPDYENHDSGAKRGYKAGCHVNVRLLGERPDDNEDAKTNHESDCDEL